MIITELYNGQGLGNQIWCYAVSKTIALDKGFDFGIMALEKFKGLGLFPNVELETRIKGGEDADREPTTKLPPEAENYYIEKKFEYNGSAIYPLDYNLINVGDKTKIDGNMQSENYIFHRKKDIKKWLKVAEKYDIKDFYNDNICIINLRGGGEYLGNKGLFLEKSYFDNAIRHMKTLTGKDLKFVVITDDISTSKSFFPDFEIYHMDLRWDYGVLHNAKYLIMANSSFSWFPAWTSNVNEITIAPKYWARHNVSDGYWACGDALTRNWKWLDRNGKLFEYEECLKEQDKYWTKNKLK